MRCRRIGFCPSSAPIRYALVNAVTQEYQYYTYNDKGLIATYYNNHNSDNYRYTYDVAGRLLSGGSLIGYGAGAIGSAFALAGGGVISSGAAVGVAAVATGVGVIVAGGVIANKLLILFSKNNPGMSNKPPVSWTDIDEGISVFKQYGDSGKAAKHLLDKKYGKN